MWRHSTLCPKGSFTPVSCSETRHPESLVSFLEASSLNCKIHHWAEFLKVVLEGTFEPCKLKGNGLNIFCTWYFCLAFVHVLGWDVGLNSLLTFCGLAVRCLCLKFGSVRNWACSPAWKIWGTAKYFRVPNCHPNVRQHIHLFHNKP